MTHTNSELRKQARNYLEGNWGTLALTTLVYYLIAESVPLSGNFFGESGNWFSLWSLLCLPLGWGLSILCLGITRGEDPTIGGLFQGYRQFGRIFIAYLWYTVLIVLWTLLLIVPGIIKALSYSMMPFILKDHPEMNGDQAINESMRLMQGHKMKLFLLILSFIGWGLLCLLTFGVGFLLLTPYMTTTTARFYQDLLDEDAARKQALAED